MGPRGISDCLNVAAGHEALSYHKLKQNASVNLDAYRRQMGTKKALLVKYHSYQGAQAGAFLNWPLRFLLGEGCALQHNNNSSYQQARDYLLWDNMSTISVDKQTRPAGLLNYMMNISMLPIQMASAVSCYSGIIHSSYYAATVGCVGHMIAVGAMPTGILLGICVGYISKRIIINLTEAVKNRDPLTGISEQQVQIINNHVQKMRYRAQQLNENIQRNNLGKIVTNAISIVAVILGHGITIAATISGSALIIAGILFSSIVNYISSASLLVIGGGQITGRLVSNLFRSYINNMTEGLEDASISLISEQISHTSKAMTDFIEKLALLTNELINSIEKTLLNINYHVENNVYNISIGLAMTSSISTYTGFLFLSKIAPVLLPILPVGIAAFTGLMLAPWVADRIFNIISYVAGAFSLLTQTVLVGVGYGLGYMGGQITSLAPQNIFAAKDIFFDAEDKLDGVETAA